MDIILHNPLSAKTLNLRKSEKVGKEEINSALRLNNYL